MNPLTPYKAQYDKLTTKKNLKGAEALAAVMQNGYALQYVPDSKKTPEICLAAVKQNGYALKCVPDSKKTPEICLAAVKRNDGALQYVPEDMFTN